MVNQGKIVREDGLKLFGKLGDERPYRVRRFSSEAELNVALLRAIGSVSLDEIIQFTSAALRLNGAKDILLPGETQELVKLFQ